MSNNKFLPLYPGGSVVEAPTEGMKKTIGRMETMALDAFVRGERTVRFPFYRSDGRKFLKPYRVVGKRSLRYLNTDWWSKVYRWSKEQTKRYREIERLHGEDAATDFGDDVSEREAEMRRAIYKTWQRRQPNTDITWDDDSVSIVVTLK